MNTNDRANVIRRRGKSRRGAAAVEFALVATVFFMFVFAIFEIGRLAMLQQIMGEACRQGARRAIGASGA